MEGHHQNFNFTEMKTVRQATFAKTLISQSSDEDRNIVPTDKRSRLGSLIARVAVLVLVVDFQRRSGRTPTEFVCTVEPRYKYQNGNPGMC